MYPACALVKDDDERAATQERARTLAQEGGERGQPHVRVDPRAGRVCAADATARCSHHASLAHRLARSLGSRLARSLLGSRLAHRFARRLGRRLGRRLARRLARHLGVSEPRFW